VNDSETNHSDRLTVLCRGEIYCAVRDLSSRVNGGEEILPPNLPLHYVSPVVRNYAETHQSLLPVSGSIFSIPSAGLREMAAQLWSASNGQFTITEIKNIKMTFTLTAVVKSNGREIGFRGLF
jgi:hypothetical protein